MTFCRFFDIEKVYSFMSLAGTGKKNIHKEHIINLKKSFAPLFMLENSTIGKLKNNNN